VHEGIEEGRTREKETAKQYHALAFEYIRKRTSRKLDADRIKTQGAYLLLWSIVLRVGEREDVRDDLPDRF